MNFHICKCRIMEDQRPTPYLLLVSKNGFQYNIICSRVASLPQCLENPTDHPSVPNSSPIFRSRQCWEPLGHRTEGATASPGKDYRRLRKAPQESLVDQTPGGKWERVGVHRSRVYVPLFFLEKLHLPFHTFCCRSSYTCLTKFAYTFLCFSLVLQAVNVLLASCTLESLSFTYKFTVNI